MNRKQALSLALPGVLLIAFCWGFIATIRYEWKAHLTAILVFMAGILVPIILLYVNNNM